MKEDEALALFIDGLFAFYKRELNSDDPFEAYVYGLRLKVAISEAVLCSRFVRGYHLLAEALVKERIDL